MQLCVPNVSPCILKNRNFSKFQKKNFFFQDLVPVMSTSRPDYLILLLKHQTKITEIEKIILPKKYY